MAAAARVRAPSRAPALGGRSRQSRRRVEPPVASLAGPPSWGAAAAAAAAARGLKLPLPTRGGSSGAAAPPSLQQQAEVAVRLEAAPAGAARLVAAMPVLAPPAQVWAALTAYDALGSFIPSLVENRVIERLERGALLHQVGAQDLPLGVTFTAACTLRITEHPAGLPAHLLAAAGGPSAAPRQQPPARGGGGGSRVSSGGGGGGGGGGRLYPFPSSQLPGAPLFGDITFDLVKGSGPSQSPSHFQEFTGLWRLQQGAAGPASAWLVYSLLVRPQPWLPVALVQSFVAGQVRGNLAAVARHAEARHAAAGGSMLV